MRESTATHAHEAAEASGAGASGLDRSPATEPESALSTPGGEPLLARVCHDLRAPLAAVVMGANFVLQALPEREDSVRSRRVLEAVLRSCRQMERLVRDFGDLSEIEGRTLVLTVDSHDAGELLALAVEAARPAASARAVDIEVRRPEAAIAVRCDRDRVLRALGHVLDNAVRAAPSGSVITTSVREEDGSASFSVSDAGPGLSDETRQHLYDRTWHATRTGRTGAGLGLCIVRGFVVAHDGRVDVASEPGRGATFSLVIPKRGPTPSIAATDA